MIEFFFSHMKIVVCLYFEGIEYMLKTSNHYKAKASLVRCTILKGQAKYKYIHSMAFPESYPKSRTSTQSWQSVGFLHSETFRDVCI